MKLVYKGKEPIRMIFPIDGLIQNGDTVEVADEFESQLKDLGFENIEIKKEGDK